MILVIVVIKNDKKNNKQIPFGPQNDVINGNKNLINYLVFMKKQIHTIVGPNRKKKNY